MQTFFIGAAANPFADPYEGIDAFVWVKPQGESDGISEPEFEPDPNDPAKRHDPLCNPDVNLKCPFNKAPDSSNIRKIS